MTDADVKTPTAETHQFQAEVAELLRLMVHSVYSETDVFLRELISNASDACDRLRYEAIAQPDLLVEDAELKIRLTPDKDAGTLTIADNGIGMDRQELIDNLGTVARSGTRAFMSKLAEAKDGTGLIGQFGVGFYSAFMVADRIVVTSRRAGSSEAFVWTSTGGAGFDIRPADEAEAARVPRGTEIVLHLKDDAKKYLEPHEIRHVVSTYSDHILFPIELAEGDKSEKINSASALWQRPKSELKPEDYKQAYQTIAHAFDEPAMTLHYKAEGRQAYAVLLFAPSTRPFDLFDPARKGHVKLYVRRVYITDDAELTAVLPALHPRRRRQRGPAAQHLARDAAEQSAGRRHAQGDHGPRHLGAGKPRRERRGGVRQDLGRVRRGSQGRHLRGSRAARGAAQARALRHDDRQGALAQAVRGGLQAEPDRDLLPGRRERRPAQVQSEARSRARPRHRGAALERSGRCVLDHDAERFRGQAAQVAEQGRGRFRAHPAAR